MTVLFRAGYDCARDGNLVIGLIETGGGGATGTVTLTSRYMPDVDLTTIYQVSRQGVAITYTLGYPSLAVILKAALEAIGAATYTVTLSTTTRKWTISASGGGVTKFDLTFNDAAKRYLGFSAGVGGALTYTGDYTAYFIIDGTVGGVTSLVRPRELADDLAVDLLASDGNQEGLAQEGAVKTFALTIPAEPAARVWHASRVTADPWTWELAFAHCRNIEPIHIVDSATGGFAYVGRLRADSCAFDPQLLADDYFAYADIRLEAHYLGTP